MAKKKNNEKEPALTPEERKEQEELKKRFQEKEKKKKQQVALLKKKEKDEIRRIKAKINFPYKLLLLVSLLFTLFAFIFLYFGAELSALDALYYTFIVFTAAYLGGGSIMLVLFYLVAEERIQELELTKRQAEDEKREAQLREQEEFEKLVNEEKEFAKKKKEITEQKRLQLEKSEEELKEHILEFQQSEDDEEIMESDEELLELGAPKEIDLTKLPTIDLEGLDLGFTDYNKKKLSDFPEADPDAPDNKAPVLGSGEYTLDDLNFDFGEGMESIPVDLDNE